MNGLQFYNNCVNWHDDDVDADGGLCDMIDNATDITRETFLKHVDLAALAKLEGELSYARQPSQGLTMAKDWHVTYHRSKLHGQTVYYFRHSAIEYVFGRAA